MTFDANCSQRPPVTDRLQGAELMNFIKPLDLPVGTFGLGLVMGGTVSAGAWTAGVLDFLTEALDAWQKAKDDPAQDVPRHDVSLAIMTGSSGGGVCGAQVTRALPYQFPHMHRDPASPTGRNNPNPVGGNGTNPLWQTWIDDLRFDAMVKTTDLDQDPTPYSLLDGAAIDIAAGNIVAYSGPPFDRRGDGTNQPRPWVHQNCQMVFALTNLRGMPYSINFETGKQNFMDRGDNARFRVSAEWTSAATPIAPEIAVMYANAPKVTWDYFADFAKSTGAFPVGFPARPLYRCISDYRYRVAVTPTDDGETCEEVTALEVDGGILQAAGIPLIGRYDFLTVDAGAINNAPVEIARSYLSGAGGRNSRDAATADRAVILIDPFADTPTFGPKAKVSLISVVQALLSGLVAQNRYNTRDLWLAAHPDIFSRFMLTARRTITCDGKSIDAVGGTAICSARFSAFFGFLSKEYSKHDYFLGRQNCRAFLMKELAMPFAENPLGYAPAQVEAYGHVDGAGVQFVPIIPVMPHLARENETPDWPAPQYTFDPESLRGAVRQRAGKVISALAKSATADAPWYLRALLFLPGWAAGWVGARIATDAVITAIKTAKDGDCKQNLPPL